MSMSSAEVEAKTRILVSFAETTFTSKCATIAAWTLLVYEHGTFGSVASLSIDKIKHLQYYA